MQAETENYDTCRLELKQKCLTVCLVMFDEDFSLRVKNAVQHKQYQFGYITGW